MLFSLVTARLSPSVEPLAIKTCHSGLVAARALQYLTIKPFRRVCKHLGHLCKNEEALFNLFSAALSLILSCLVLEMVLKAVKEVNRPSSQCKMLRVKMNAKNGMSRSNVVKCQSKIIFRYFCFSHFRPLILPV